MFARQVHANIIGSSLGLCLLEAVCVGQWGEPGSVEQLGLVWL
jgi:hypothetical protein